MKLLERFLNSRELAVDDGLVPPGRYYMATWGIPPNFGGLTTVLIRRARAIAEIGGMPSDILTFSATFDLAAQRTNLGERGMLSGGVRLRNMWEELAELSDRGLRRALGRERLRGTFESFLPLHPSDVSEESKPGQPLAWASRTTKAGATLQVDYYRPDGSLLLSDRRDALMRGRRGGRVLTLCDRAGIPLTSWREPGELYGFWLDQVTSRGAQSFVMIDSAFLNRFVHDYRRRNVVTVQSWHSSHLATVPPPGPSIT